MTRDQAIVQAERIAPFVREPVKVWEYEDGEAHVVIGYAVGDAKVIYGVTVTA
ncbi:MAG TPA: hypothetical protein VN817_06945 [Solirubrobacteraceae bacterium]|nr:hypothetical protein [Solirubrobacteraceae bacterium]